VTKSARRFVLFAVLAVLLLLVFAAGAFAYPGINGSTEKQVAPGQTLRSIYGSCQVFMYKLPHNVTHDGYIHVEMKYGWPDYDCYVYLIRQNVANGVWEQAATSDGVSSDQQGWNGDFYGKEVIDFYVEDVLDQTVNTAGDDLTGDEYYVMVQSFDDVSRFELSGYYPRVAFDPDAASNPVDGGNWFRGKFQFPKTGRVQIYGAPYGGPFNFTPTSVGNAYINTRYPWNATNKTVQGLAADGVTKVAVGPRQPMPEYLDGRQLAAFDQYLYPGDWSESGSLWDMAGSGLGHWAQNHTQGGNPPATMLLDPAWTRRISARQTIALGTNMAPDTFKIYIPVLWMVSSDPTQGRYAPPASGMSTIGYLGEIQYPQNLYLNKAATKVKNGKVSLTGNLAIAPLWDDPTGAASGTIGWAPADTVVTIQARIGKGAWKKVGTGKVAGTEGVWTASVKAVNGTAQYRAVWTGARMQSITVQFRNDTNADPVATTWTDWMSKDITGTDQGLYPGGEYSILSASLDPTAGIGFKSANLVGGNPWLSAVIKSGDPAISVVFDNKPGLPVEIKFGSVNNYFENSLGTAQISN
jgi:hypothetical protein